MTKLHDNPYKTEYWNALKNNVFKVKNNTPLLPMKEIKKKDKVRIKDNLSKQAWKLYPYLKEKLA